MNIRGISAVDTLRKRMTGVSLECLAIVGIFLCGVSGMAKMLPEDGVLASALRTPDAADAQEPEQGSALASRIALRMGERLKRNGQPVAPQARLEQAVLQRQQLLSSKIAVVFERQGGGISESWNATPQAYPLWIRPTFSKTEAVFALDKDAIRASIHEHFGARLIAPQDVVLEKLEERGEGVIRAHTTGVAKPGEVLDEETAASAVMNALLAGGSGSLTVPIDAVAGKIANASGQDLGALTLLATGQSNYKGSGWGRIQNVKKAFRDHVNNTVVAPGQTYSFNQMLEGPVTTGNGWYMAKVIENGVDLVDAPGGGICQASTTMFRAMLNAGFVPVERKAHSLYVTFYEEHGVGIDATIFPGKQDLTFVNDTPNYLLVQAYDDGFDAYVHIYGTDDDRTVDLRGPYFSSTAHMSDVPLDGLNHNEIAWVHTVQYADGREVQNLVRSRYRAIPRTLAQKYTLHASAGDAQ